MAFNPLAEKGIPIEKQFRNWAELAITPYNKNSVDAYSRARVITLNGLEIEAALFGHQFARNCTNPDILKELAVVRRVEQQQQKAVAGLVPADETTLEHTIGYEQVAVDLTAFLARNEPDPYVRQVFEFGLLEDFDHLYRYSNLLHLLEEKRAENLVGGYTEIMPGRPTVQEHRFPMDDLRRHIDSKTADPRTKMHILTLRASEQQTMNFYMTMANRFQEPLARGLYNEIGQIEEQHVTQYESLCDPTESWLERQVLHEYNECYVYYSFMTQEVDPRIKQLWELHLGMELEHLKIACDLMRRHEKRDPQEILPKEISEVLTFEPNKDYIRRLISEQLNLTSSGTEIVPLASLSDDAAYYKYQKQVNAGIVPSENVITQHMQRMHTDYRFQTEGPYPAG